MGTVIFCKNIKQFVSLLFDKGILDIQNYSNLMSYIKETEDRISFLENAIEQIKEGNK